MGERKKRNKKHSLKKYTVRVTLDLDSTVKTVYGRQQGAEKGYNPTHPGKRIYNPLIAFIAETGEALMGWLRPGDTFSANGSLGSHTALWQADGLPSGVYFCRLESTRHSEAIKLVLIR